MRRYTEDTANLSAIRSLLKRPGLLGLLFLGVAEADKFTVTQAGHGLRLRGGIQRDGTKDF
jgi:hypothetical protein